MKPYYQHNGITIYHGDAREILPGLEAQALITDPVWPNCPPNLLAGGDRPYDLFRELMATPPQGLLRIVIILRADSDPRFLAPVPMPFFSAQQLPYAMPGYIGRKLGGDEIAYSFGEPVACTPGRRLIPGRGPIAQPSDRPNNGHPCSRALVHIKWLVNWWSDPGETIIDPCCGSGTLGRAAKDLGRNAILVDVEERYCEMSANRMSQEVMAL